jgi:hypothetical protein
MTTYWHDLMLNSDHITGFIKFENGPGRAEPSMSQARPGRAEKLNDENGPGRAEDLSGRAGPGRAGPDYFGPCRPLYQCLF